MTLKLIVPLSIASSLYLLKVCPASVPASILFTPNVLINVVKSPIFLVPKLLTFIAITSFENTFTSVPAVVIGLFETGIDKSISINVELPLNSILELVKSIFPCPSEYTA